MITRVKKILSNLKFYSVHSQARLRSNIALTLFATLDSLSSGYFKVVLKERSAQFLPALLTFILYLVTFWTKARENYDSSDIRQHQLKQPIVTTAILRELFLRNSHDAVAYLAEAKVDAEIVRRWLSPHVSAEDTLDDIPHEIFRMTVGHRNSYSDAFFNSLLQGFAQLNEYRLLKEFTSIDLLALSDDSTVLNIIGYAILASGLYTAFITFRHGITPISDTEILREVKTDFLMYKINQDESHLKDISVPEFNGLEDDASENSPLLVNSRVINASYSLT